MRFTFEASSDGVREQHFVLDEIPGVLWTPREAVGTRPLILLGHGGGQQGALRRRPPLWTNRSIITDLPCRRRGRRVRKKNFRYASPSPKV
jgi:hypothetical protein